MKSLAFSENGHHLIAGFDNGSVRVWDLAGGGRQTVLRGHDEQVHGVLMLPDNRTLVSGAKEIRVWDIATGKELLQLNPRPARYQDMALSPDHRRLAVGASDGLVTIWDVASWQEVATLKGHRESARRAAFLPDGNTLVSVSQEQVRVWRAASIEEADASRHSK